MPNEMRNYVSIEAVGPDGEDIFKSKGDYRAAFECRSSMDEKAGECRIKLYGVSDPDSNKILHNAMYIRLIAGRMGSEGEIFYGELVDGFIVELDQEQYLYLSVVDGDSFFSSYVNASIGAGETPGGLAQKCVEGCTSPIEIGFITPSAYSSKLARGAVLFGSPIDICKSVAKGQNAALYVLKERLYITGLFDSPAGDPIPVESGMIGVPSRDNFFASFRHEISSSIFPGVLVQFESNGSRMNYRVISVSSVGDTKSGEWYMAIMAIGQSGDRPNATAVTANVWR